MSGEDQQWFYHPDTGEVAQGRQASWDRRMGPYPSADEARNAMQLAAERTAQADAYDEADEDWGVPPSWER